MITPNNVQIHLEKCMFMYNRRVREIINIENETNETNDVSKIISQSIKKVICQRELDMVADRIGKLSFLLTMSTEENYSSLNTLQLIDFSTILSNTHNYSGWEIIASKINTELVRRQIKKERTRIFAEYTNLLFRDFSRTDPTFFSRKYYSFYTGSENAERWGEQNIDHIYSDHDSKKIYDQNLEKRTVFVKEKCKELIKNLENATPLTVWQVVDHNWIARKQLEGHLLLLHKEKSIRDQKN